MINYKNRACAIRQVDGEKEILPMKAAKSSAKCEFPEMGQIGGFA